MRQYFPTQSETKKQNDALNRLNDRLALMRSELHKLGDMEFTRRYLTGPRKPGHLVKF